MFIGIIIVKGCVCLIMGIDIVCFEIEVFYDVNMIDMGVFIVYVGVCLIVVEKENIVKGCWYVVEVLLEILCLIMLGDLGEGSVVNLECVLVMGEEFGGYLVIGYVDGVGEVVDWCDEGEWVVFIIWLLVEFNKYIVKKGLVMVDGVLLIVNDVICEIFDLMIIFYIVEVMMLG